MKSRVFWDVAPLKWTYVSEVHTASIIRFIATMMEPVRTSEMSVHFNGNTRCYIPEDSRLHTLRRENLISHRGDVKFTQTIVITMLFANR
jgi:hypothetical protein